MKTSTQWQLDRDSAQAYERLLVPWILGPAAKALVDSLPLFQGAKVLDIGCGTGAAARFAGLAVGSGGRVVGVDVNAAMLEVARGVAGGEGAPFEWVEGNGADLREVGSFDFVVCAQTLQFVPDPVRVVREMRRVLAPGGVAGISAWSEVGASPYFKALVVAMSEEVGRDAARGLETAFNLSDSDALLGLVASGGFENGRLRSDQFEVTLPEMESFVPAHIAATPMSVAYDAASPEARDAVIRRIERAMMPYAVDGGVRVPFSTHLVTALVDA